MVQSRTPIHCPSTTLGGWVHGATLPPPRVTQKCRTTVPYKSIFSPDTHPLSKYYSRRVGPWCHFASTKNHSEMSHHCSIQKAYLKLLTLFSVEHTNTLDCAVVGNPLAEPPSMGRSNRLGGSNRLWRGAV
jgi:hypothetical protein